MKQIINKEDKAVSPIIATILLIAITVVLAATLYTVLGGFTKGLSTGNPTASVSFVQSGSTPNYSISFSSISGNVSMSSLSLVVYNKTNVGSLSLNGVGSTNVKLTTNVQKDFYNVSVSGANSGFLSVTTVISISGYSGSNNHTLARSYNNTITSITIKDTSTNSSLTSNTPPAPAIIATPVAIRID